MERSEELDVEAIKLRLDEVTPEIAAALVAEVERLREELRDAMAKLVAEGVYYE